MNEEIRVEYYGIERARRLGKNFVKQYGITQSKYKNKKKNVDGIDFHSGDEADFYSWLKMLVRVKDVLAFEKQVKFELFAWAPKAERKKMPFYMLVDFLVTIPSGEKQCWEYKGFETREWKIKKSVFVANYPTMKYMVWKRNKYGFYIDNSQSIKQ